MSSNFLTPKAIANRMKAKGLQRLRWWCELCQKQCRDENGFKQHATSEGHLRNMQLYAHNPKKFQDQFSMEFKNNFLRELSRRHSTNRIKANTFYTELIKDKEHVHMNSTRWRSLTEFIMDLSREGSVKAEDTEKGWFITYIDRTVGAVMSDEQRKAERDRLELDDAERDRQRSLAQLRAAEKSGELSAHVSATELQRENEGAHLEFALPDHNDERADEPKKRPLDFEENDQDEEQVQHQQQAPRKLSKLEEIALKAKERQEQTNKKMKSSEQVPSPPDAWLVKGLIVKVMNKKLENGLYYKKKAIVFDVHNGGSIGDVEILDDSKDALRLASTVLETVLPQPGGQVMIVQGELKHRMGELVKLNIEKFSADVNVDGRVVTLPYEAVCKIKTDVK